MTRLLREVAGELSDLIEGAQLTGGPGVDKGTPGKGGTSDLTPGSVEAKAPAGEKVKEPSEYTYSQEDEGEEEEIEVEEPLAGAVTGEATPAEVSKGGHQEEEKFPEAEESKEDSGKEGGKRRKEVRSLPAASGKQLDPHYLSRALQLRPTYRKGCC